MVPRGLIDDTDPAVGGTLVWIIDDAYLPRPLLLGAWTLQPVNEQDVRYALVVRRFVLDRGLPLKQNQVPAGRITAVAMSRPIARGEGVELALRDSRTEAEIARSALGVRQYGAGRVLGGFVHRPDGTVTSTLIAGREPRRVTNLPFVPEEEEVQVLIDGLRDHPQAQVIADLFGEACREARPEAAIARLWTILEVLAEGLRGSKLAKVRNACAILEIAEPDVHGIPLLSACYDVRNAFMHEGRLQDPAAAIRLALTLTDHVWMALRLGGMQPVRRAD